MSAAEFDDALFDRVSDVVGPVTVILTLSTKNLNRITAVDRKGVWVETERSMSLGSGPQLVPAWMIAVAWDRLCDKGELSQQELLNELNVKRSAFVCALVAKFPEVHIRSTRPTVVELDADSLSIHNLRRTPSRGRRRDGGRGVSQRSAGMRDRTSASGAVTVSLCAQHRNRGARR